MSNVAGGVGGTLSSLFGGQNQFFSQVDGPNANSYVNQRYAQDAGAYSNALKASGAAAVPVAGVIAQNKPSDQDRTQLQNLALTLGNTANGNGPSVASQQLQQGLQQQLQQQQAAAAGAHAGGANPFLAQRQLADQTAQAQQATNAAIGQQRAQEALTAQNNLGGVLSNMNQSDIGAAQFNAQQQQQANFANQAAQQQQIQNANNANQFYAQGLSGLDQQQVQNSMGYEQANQQNAQYNNSVNAGISQANTNAAGTLGNSIFGGAMSTLSSGLGAVAASDERVKTQIDRSRLEADMHEFLSTLDPASWNYSSPEKHGDGRHYGVMAQSTERSKAGKSFTFDAPDGTKMLDTRKATGVALAALAHMHRRQERFERAIKKGGK